MTFGLPAQAAKRLGLDPTVVTGAGTSQATAQAIGQFQFFVRAVAGGASAYGYIMTSVAEVGSEYTVVCESSTTVILWPPSGGQFISTSIVGATATGVSLAIGRGAFVLAVTATTFDVLISA
jgi:hypothetical protein